MNGSNDTFGSRAKRTFTRLITALIVLGLAGLAAVLLSRLNARTYSLEVREGQLVVMKGRNLPMGAVPFRPSDPQLLDAYAPIPLEGQDASSLVSQSFSDRDDLDRALFSLLERLAAPRIASDDPKALEQGLLYVRRAEKLSGITEGQRQTLKAMLAEVSFYIARTRLDDARRLVSEALHQLKLAAESDNRHARAANQMLTEVEPHAKALEVSLRTAVHSLSQPAPATPGPSPAGQPSQNAINGVPETPRPAVPPGAAPGGPAAQ